jgi:CheY-like chemotaxis protein
MCLRADNPRPLSILVVDYLRDAADALGTLLCLNGHQTHVASDAEAALRVAQDVPLDAVLLDIAMPKCDGYRLAARLRPLLPTGVVFVAVTGFGTAADKERALREGFDHHFTKPADLQALLGLLTDVSRRPA